MVSGQHDVSCPMHSLLRQQLLLNQTEYFQYHCVLYVRSGQCPDLIVPTLFKAHVEKRHYKSQEADSLLLLEPQHVMCPFSNAPSSLSLYFYFGKHLICHKQEKRYNQKQQNGT